MRTRRFAIAAGLLALAACNFDILNTNQPTQGDLLSNPTRDKLEAAAGEALQRADVLERLEDDGAAASAMRADAFAAFMATERQRWGDVIRDANITLKE